MARARRCRPRRSIRREYCVLGIDYLGGRGGSSAPETGGKFPPLSSYDQAHALYRIVEHLGLKSLHAIVGASYGGMVALCFAEAYAERVGRIVVLSAADKSQVLSTAWRSVQRQIVREAIARGDGPAGLKLARALAMATYRSAVEFELRFGAAPEREAHGFRFPVEDYLFARGDDYVQKYRAETFLALERVDRPAPHGRDARAHARDADRRARGSAGPVPGHAGPGGAAQRPAPAHRDQFHLRPRRIPERGCGADADRQTRSFGAAPMSKEKSRKALSTRSVRAGLESDAQHGSVVPPIYLSSNFAFEAYRKPRKYDYSRSGNPTRDQLAVALADLEGGAGGVVTCTGLAAITLVLATLPQGARVLAPHDCYGGTYRLLAALHAQGKLVADFVDQSDADALSAALASKPRARVDRDPEQSAAARGGHSRHCPGGARRRCAGGGGQHLPLAALAATARTRSGPRRAFDDQIPERPQRCGGRRRHRGHGRARAEPRLVGECHRCDRLAVRQLSELARPADVARAHGGARRRMRPRWSSACGVTRRCARCSIRASPIIRGTTSRGVSNRASARC